MLIYKYIHKYNEYLINTQIKNIFNMNNHDKIDTEKSMT